MIYRTLYVSAAIVAAYMYLYYCLDLGEVRNYESPTNELLHALKIK